MKQVSNVRHGTGWAHVAVVLPALVLPLLAVGFTVEPALRLRRIDSEAEGLREELGLTGPGLPSRHEELEPLDGQAGQMLARQLRSLVPQSLDTVQVYGAARRAAESCGVSLASIQLGIDTRVDGAGTDLGSRGLNLTGRGSAERLTALVRNVRALGYPCRVEGVQLTTSSTDDTVQFQLGLGLYHRSPEFSDSGLDLE